MPVFPPAAPVAVFIDGRPLAAYAGAYLWEGRVYAPVAPLFTHLADKVWFEQGMLVVERDGRRVRVPYVPGARGSLDVAYVAVGPLLRALGESVAFAGGARRLDIRTPSAPAVASPPPFDATLPSSPPRPVFTPEPVPTPRPVWTGSPLPRRTALPVVSPRPAARRAWRDRDTTQTTASRSAFGERSAAVTRFAWSSRRCWPDWKSGRCRWRKAALEVAAYQSALAWAAQTALRDIIGTTMLAELLSDRQALDQRLQQTVDARTTPWGITVQSVELRDIRIPAVLQDAMSRQAQAERERQARVILGQAEQEIALHLRAMNMLYEGLKEKGARSTGCLGSGPAQAGVRGD